MHQHLNTLFITTQGAWLAKQGQAVVVRVQRKPVLRVPLHNLGSIVCFGRINVTPILMAACASAGIAISFLSEHGRFLARVCGFTPGNVLLRRQQYRLADAAAARPSRTASAAPPPGNAGLAVARNMVAAKVANARGVLLRFPRDYPDSPASAAVSVAADHLRGSLDQIEACGDLDALRGLEGIAASAYFGVFNGLITAEGDDFAFRGRNRRPPLDRTNAMLSFLYAMLLHDARAACEAVGLDAAVGFLHRDRPGRPGLALDLMEELRPFLADRLALSLINRRQVQPDGFTVSESGGVLMNDATRKLVIISYQKRKQEEITHPFLNEKVTVGLLVHLQARLLARFVRGDLDAYPAFVWK